MVKKLVSALTAFAVFAVLSPASFAADRTLAIVNGEAIFESEFDSVANPVIEQYRNTTPQASQNIADINQRKDAVLDRLVEFTLLKQDAKKNKVSATNQEVRDAVSQIRQQGFNNNEAAFNDALKRENLTRTKFEARIADQLTVNKYINQSIEKRTARPTEEQIRTFYDKVKIKSKGGQTGLSADDDQFAGQVAVWLKRISGDRVSLRQIVIAAPRGITADQLKVAESRVNEVKRQLSAGRGDNFAQLASQYSDDASTRQNGGNLGIVTKGDLVPAIDNAIFKLAAGRYTANPIRIADSGFYFFKIDEKFPPKEPTFDDIKADLLNAYYQNEANKTYARFIGELRAKANITLKKTW